MFKLFLKLFNKKGLQFDLGDSANWEFMLPSNEKPNLLLPNQDADDEDVITKLKTFFLFHQLLLENVKAKANFTFIINNQSNRKYPILNNFQNYRLKNFNLFTVQLVYELTR